MNMKEEEKAEGTCPNKAVVLKFACLHFHILPEMINLCNLSTVQTHFGRS